MKFSDYFIWQRFRILVNLELLRSKKGLLLTLVVAFGLLFTGFVLTNIFSSKDIYDEHEGSYAFFLLTGGFILSSLAFNDLSNPLRRYHYLTLPASTFEKFLSMWILTCIGWIAAFTILFTLYSLIANSLGHFFFRHTLFMPYIPLSSLTLHSAGLYIIFQGIFLVAAVHFRAYVFPKTIFTVILFALACGLILYLLMADIIHTSQECPPDFNPLKEQIFAQIWIIVRWFGTWILAPLCWIIAYFGLKEQEV